MTDGGDTDRRLIFMSPTERGEHVNILRRIMEPVIDPICEARGVDFLWAANGELWGVQRKTIADLWASVDDGRLNVELGQISTELNHAVFIIEGKVQATIEGVFVAGRQSRHVGTHFKALMTLASRGHVVIQTESAQHTGFAIKALCEWSRDGKHGLGNVRPKATGKWGKVSSREWGVHMLQGFPGIGYETAMSIVEAHGVPLQWTVGERELQGVAGVGKVRARKLIEALQVNAS